MISLRDGRITDILPEHLARPLEVQAYAYALHRQMVKLCDMADATRIYAAIQSAPDEILDYLAAELRTPCYDMNFSTQVKRSLILSTLPYYMRMGTTTMVNSIITTIFGNGRIKEFFEYDGAPHHFKVQITGAEATTRPTSEFREVLEQVKRKSQWLDAVELEFDTMERVGRIGGTMASIMTTPLEEQPDEFQFRHVIHIGGAGPTINTTPLGEQPDEFQFRQALRIGGTVGAVHTSPVPPEADKLDFIASVNAGGGMGTVQTTPLPEL